jgi:hypothetical protein
MGFEPMNTGFADQRVSHFATGALIAAILFRVAVDFDGPISPS